MPEMPEVETITRDLANVLPDQKIENIVVHDARVIKSYPPKFFIKHLEKKTISQITRRAKAIIFHLKEGGFLVTQLKMTGYYLYRKNPLELISDIKVTFNLSSGDYLYYLDQRTFGWLIFTDSLDEVSYLRTAGPEPLNEAFHSKYVQAALAKRPGPIKNILLDQCFVAGIGNIYASEILFAASIHPQKRACDLTKNDITRLISQTQKILNKAIALRGTSMRNYRDSQGKKGGFMRHVKVYGRVGQKCPRCRLEVERIVQAGRSTFFCSSCQN